MHFPHVRHKLARSPRKSSSQLPGECEALEQVSSLRIETGIEFGVERGIFHLIYDTLYRIRIGGDRIAKEVILVELIGEFLKASKFPKVRRFVRK